MIDTLKAKAWGTMHPDYDSDVARARWTPAELAYIEQYCVEKKTRQPDCQNVVAQCLRHIHRDPNATPIFHRIHVLDSGRLRNGYREFQKQKQLKALHSAYSDDSE